MRLRRAARETVKQIAQAGGFLVYLRQEGRSIGLYAKLRYEADLALGHRQNELSDLRGARRCSTRWGLRVALLNNNPQRPDSSIGSG